ncbi:MarR family winged helix-turn-helix transcriptional regulator [Microtetraspora fusca]|uniref:MarR family winged helix-turn-helix transcriptional regulator n=1 Tax=Microtetraspora fusca TaxID=1997 RepID=A0ABW6V9G2_MICFU
MRHDPPGAARELAATLHDIARHLRLRGEAVAGLRPLSPTEFEVLRLVDRSPGICPGAVAEALGMRPSNLSATVRKLTQQGLIERRTDPDDRRGVRLALTGEAAKDVERLEAAWAANLAALLDRLPSEHASALVAALPALRALRDVSLPG